MQALPLRDAWLSYLSYDNMQWLAGFYRLVVNEGLQDPLLVVAAVEEALQSVAWHTRVDQADRRAECLALLAALADNRGLALAFAVQHIVHEAYYQARRAGLRTGGYRAQVHWRREWSWDDSRFPLAWELEEVDDEA